MAINIAIQGRLFEDAIYRETAGGKPVVTLKIPLYAGKKGDKYNPSQWYTVVVWDTFVDECRGYKKGDKVIVYGFLGYREWEGKNGKQGTFEITAKWVGQGDEISLPDQVSDFIPEDDDI